MAGGREFDWKRFTELVLYITERSSPEADPLMSRVKLNKLLYRADTEAFRLLGRSISGAVYIKGEHGPMAEALPRAERYLENRGFLRWKHEPAGPHTRKVPIAEFQAEHDFSPEELAIVGAALKELAEYGGKKASDWSHDRVAMWRVTEMDEEIPYETVVISSERPPEKAFARATQRAKAERWHLIKP